MKDTSKIVDETKENVFELNMSKSINLETKKNKDDSIFLKEIEGNCEMQLHVINDKVTVDMLETPAES